MEREANNLSSLLGDERVSNIAKRRATSSTNKLTARLQEELEAQQKREREILAHNKAWVQDIQDWLELTSQTCKFWKMANFEQKTYLASKLFLELTILDGKIFDHRYNKAYAELGKGQKVVNGGRCPKNLELLIDVIQFDENVYHKIEDFNRFIEDQFLTASV